MNTTDSTIYAVCDNANFALDPLWSCFLTNPSEFEAMREIINTHLFHYFRRGYVYTRCFESGLAVSEHFFGVLNQNLERLSLEEQIAWFDELALLKLYMLDYLNWFELYLRYFDELRAVNQNRTDCPITITAGYEYRYKVVKRKHEKSLVCKKVGNLLRHQQGQLSPQEVARRYDYVIEKIRYEQENHTGNTYF